MVRALRENAWLFACGAKPQVESFVSRSEAAHRTNAHEAPSLPRAHCCRCCLALRHLSSIQRRPTLSAWCECGLCNLQALREASG